MLMLAVFFLPKTHNLYKYVHISALIISISGLVIVASAPGNEARMAQLGGGGIKWLTPFYGIYKAAGVLILTTFIMYILTANSYIAGLAQRLSLALDERLGNVTTKQGVIFALSVLALYAAAYMPSYWAAGGAPEGRTKTILYILPLILWIPAMSFVRSFITENNIDFRWISHRKPFVAKLSIVALVALAFTMNIKDIVLDAYWRGSSYDAQLVARYAEIEEAKKSGRQNLIVGKLHDLPQSLYFGDILSDPEHWRNRCYKNYFKLQSIKVTE
jgi:hypothetical protein